MMITETPERAVGLLGRLAAMVALTLVALENVVPQYHLASYLGSHRSR